MADQTHPHRLVLLPCLAVLLLFPSFASASVTIRNIPRTPHFAPANTPLSELANSIEVAAASEGWVTVVRTPGVIRASLRIRTHKSDVAIYFDKSDFWIEYIDSDNLDYNPKDRKKTRTRRGIKGPRIHLNYNRWVEDLARSIEIYARIPRQSDQRLNSESGDPLLIADELEKLDALRQRGVLSQGEFDQQKAKLLAR